MIIKDSFKKFSKFLKKIECLKILIPIVGIIVANLELLEIFRVTGRVAPRFIIFDLILNFTIVYLCVVISKKNKEIEKNNEYIEFLNERNLILTEMNDNTRSFRHDFNNIIQAIDGYILLGDMEALKVYFSKLLKECKHLNKLDLLATNAVKDPAIYGVLSSKYRLADAKNIRMNIDVLMDFSNMQEKSYCLSRILGILLDNAIEASLECEEKYINVQFLEGGAGNKKRIIIENTYKDKEIDTNLIFQKDYSTKKQKGNSGIGLWKVRDMVRKEQKISLQTTKDQRFFKQELFVM